MFNFHEIKHSAIAAIAAILFSAATIAAAVGPAQISKTVPAPQAQA
jgi:hypothetical protein